MESREKGGWAEGRQQGERKRVALAEDDGKENAERSRRRIADPMLKDPGQNDRGNAITAAEDRRLRGCEMSRTARCIVDCTEPKSNLLSADAIGNSIGNERHLRRMCLP